MAPWTFLPNWGFRNTVNVTHSSRTVDLPLKNSPEVDGTATIPFNELVKQYVPQAAEEFKFLLKPYLFTGTLQSLYIPYADFSKSYQVSYAREIVEVTEDDAKKFTDLPAGQFTIDYVVDPIEKTPEKFKKRYEETLPEGYPRLHPRCRYYTEKELEQVFKTWGSDDKPIVIVAPGLAGGVNEPQIRAVGEKLFNSGFHSLVLNSRGCCRSPLTTPHLFTGLHTDDMRLVVNRLHKQFPDKQIHLAGFSFGGVIISNYLAQEGSNSIISSAVTVSSPWNLLDSCTALNSSYSGRNIFQPAIIYFLNKLVQNNRETLKQASDIYDEEEFNRVKKTFKTTEDFDDKYTGPLAGWPSGATYYLASSPIMRVFKIKTPLLILNSKDDPIISTAYPYHEVEKSPYLYMATCDLGGHYSFIDIHGKFWYVDVINEFINAFYNNVDQTRKLDDHGFNVKQGGFRDTIDLY
ncbi:DEKNAAC100728 [Brettanomyces naardenensis]|uniref:DEKNAAC100728 n=1 Tax=Brettanomyces naardenensis TaxID=13370 RepID=A0A448YG46_BRENA|nr:DEKNAAC100728 [Brettanomyces naardenensis]